MRKFQLLVLLLILVGAFTVRLYKFNNPIADWHSWRQSDTSAVSRNFAQNGFDLLHPKFGDLSMGVSLIDNPQGHRFVEFPIYNAAQAGLFKYVGWLPIEQWGRLVTIFASLGSIIFIYLIAKRYLTSTAALFAAGFFAFIPYNIYYGRVVLPDPSMVMSILGGIYFFIRWIDTPKHKILSFTFLLSMIFTAAAFLLKPYALFFTLPMIYLSFQKFRSAFVKQKRLWLFLVITILPLILWQIWIRQYPAGIPQTGWLFNGSNIRFSGAFFHWIFAERIGEFILGYFGLPFVILGIMRKTNQKEGIFFLTFLLSSFLYMFVLATGNVQHDYYQILVIPTFAIFFGKGADMVFTNLGGMWGKKVARVTALICIAFMLAFSWFVVRDFYNIQHPEIIELGKAVDRLVPKDAKIIAPYGGDTTLLYNTGKIGWPVFDRPLEDFIKQGATHMIFVEPSAPELNFKNYFKVVEQKDKYIIYDLNSPLKPLQ